MILKEKDTHITPSTARQQAGLKQEQDVAFYLRRAFKNCKDVLVINDLRIEHDGEAAQVDHLIISEIGFCLIESKSLKAEININLQGEWTRKYRNTVTGIKSPIKQVELQADLLKALLTVNKAKILGKVLGLMQQGVGGREWQCICAVSSDAVINRRHLKPAIGERVMKSEFVADWVSDKMTFGTGLGRKLRALRSDKVKFTRSEMTSIADFLLAQHKPLVWPKVHRSAAANPEATNATHIPVIPTAPTFDAPPEEASAKTPSVEVLNAHAMIAAEASHSAKVLTVTHGADTSEATNSKDASDVKPALLVCKQCKSREGLKGLYGQYGYFVKCMCGATTTMKQNCPRCVKAMRITKRKTHYSASCGCGVSDVVFEEKESVEG